MDVEYGEREKQNVDVEKKKKKTARNESREGKEWGVRNVWERDERKEEKRLKNY